MRELSARPRRSSGQSLVEFALAAPFIIILLLGGAQVGLLVYDYLSIGTAAREGARVGSENPVNSGVFSAPLPQTLSPACTTSSTNPVCVAIFHEANNSSNFGLLDTSKITTVVSSAAPYQAGQSCPLSGPSSSLPNDGLITVKVSYPVPIFVPIVGQFFGDSGNAGQRTLTRTVTMRIEPCTVTQGN
jgi:Flp pilus assembly protein TadG